jgi:hypothetical protein
MSPTPAGATAERVGRYLQRQGLLERDAETSDLTGDGLEAGLMGQLISHSITYRIAVGPQAGRRVFTLQTLPDSGEAFDDSLGQVSVFSLHASVAAKAHQRQRTKPLSWSGGGAR